MMRDKVPAKPEPLRKRVVIVKMSVNFLLDFAGPFDVFNYADKALRLSGSSRGYDVTVVSPTRENQTVTKAGLEIGFRCCALDFGEPIDTLLVAGNEAVGPESPDYTGFYSWLAAMGEASTRRIGSVCGGAFVLAKAGLLDGRRATTHLDLCERLKDSYPRVKVDAHAFHTQDGPIYTSGGMTSGLDLALAMVEQDFGRDLAVDVARKLVVYLRRPGSQVQFGHLLPVFENSTIAEKLRPWLSEHLHEQLDIVRMATHLSMSPRNFTRVFHQQTGLPPAKYIEKLRVESARKYLEDTDYSLERIAERCGLGGLVSMRRTFLRHLTTTPSDYRRAFRSSLAVL